MNKLEQKESSLKIFVNVIVIILSLWGISRKEFKSDSVPYFQKILIEVFAPVQEGTNAVRASIEALFRNYIFLFNTKKENEALKETIEKLKATIFELQETVAENKRLKDLLKFSEQHQVDKIMAKVIAKDHSSFFKIIRINKGEKDGISPKNAVITAQGLVGRIIKTTPNYSDILTILDPNNRIDAIVTRTRSDGIVEGYRDYLAHMKYVMRNEDVQIGDIVMSAGLSDLYPKGLPIGIVKKVEKESSGITQFILIEPSVDFSKIEEVLVLIDRKTKQ